MMIDFLFFFLFFHIFFSFHFVLSGIRKKKMLFVETYISYTVVAKKRED